MNGKSYFLIFEVIDRQIASEERITKNIKAIVSTRNSDNTEVV